MTVGTSKLGMFFCNFCGTHLHKNPQLMVRIL